MVVIMTTINISISAAVGMQVIILGVSHIPWQASGISIILDSPIVLHSHPLKALLAQKKLKFSNNNKSAKMIIPTDGI